MLTIMFSPRAQHVVIGGGQDARDVTTTAARDGKFDARFFHMLLEEEFGRVKGHFGPINTLAFHPDGKSYCSGEYFFQVHLQVADQSVTIMILGAEDGFIRAHKFDRDYLSYKDELTA